VIDGHSLQRLFLQELERFHGLHAFLVSAGFLACIWLWTVWDYCHHPRRREAPARWYTYYCESQVERWDLRCLEQEFSDEADALRAESNRRS
jgi:hypothetical protein